ncbi:MAG: L-serine ammonia-lyase [bacterium]
MEKISVFDMLKIGIGPSSSHTLGPWRAAQRFVGELEKQTRTASTRRICVSLYGSLALTGKGHGTDIAALLGLSGTDPEDIPLADVSRIPEQVRNQEHLDLGGRLQIPFKLERDLIFFMQESLPFHANGIRFEAFDENEGHLHKATYYSVGGGFVVAEDEIDNTSSETGQLPYPIESAADLKRHCDLIQGSISDVVMENEKSWRSEDQVQSELLRIWSVMKMSIYRGCTVPGRLPGGLDVVRRAPDLCNRLLGMEPDADCDNWIESLKTSDQNFSSILKWIGCFAIAVNEENASFGRIVTAPTNGAAGVVPAVLLYLICFSGRTISEKDIVRFLLVAGEIGSIFKKRATISAAMGGCQAEIGVSSAMAAAALTEALGGTVAQAMMAAEMAMEHHLGLTCDPVNGLVQIPCIERNSMGAVKAITAANIALESDPGNARVSLDDVIQTMWETAQDMNAKYKETSQGGLAVRISIAAPEC